MWPWLTRVAVDAGGVTLGDDRFVFADLADASFDGTTLVLHTTSDAKHRARVRGGLALLERILDGITAAHPRTSTVYRTAAGSVDAGQGEPHRGHRLHRRTATVGSPDLGIGRTLYK
jgi:hypothetical protein